MKKLLIVFTLGALAGGVAYFYLGVGAPAANLDINLEDTRTDEEVKLEAEKKNLRNNWENLIVIRRETFAKKKIAGITMLQVSIANSTRFAIDEARATVNYLNLVGDIVDSKEVTFTNVAPNGSKRLKVPDSSRGVDVRVVTDFVRSKELNLCTGDGNWRSNQTADDPYRCE